MVYLLIKTLKYDFYQLSTSGWQGVVLSDGSNTYDIRTGANIYIGKCTNSYLDSDVLYDSASFTNNDNWYHAIIKYDFNVISIEINDSDNNKVADYSYELDLNSSYGRFMTQYFGTSDRHGYENIIKDIKIFER